LPCRSTDHGLGDTFVAPDRLDDRHGGFRISHQKKYGGRAMVDEFVAHGRTVNRALVEFDERAPVSGEMVPQNADPRCPVHARRGSNGDSTMARAQEEVRVDPPAMGLHRGKARDPFRWLFGEGVKHC
jgi:hypothetical protein